MLNMAVVFADNFVGSEVCSGCHTEEYQQWKHSHHDLAMQVASAETVLGNFNKQTFTYFDQVSTFFKKDDKFYITTDGHNGAIGTYQIAYTFGVYPLQQYLIEFSDGRLQSLSIAWDSRPIEEGGQKWFHLYPDKPIKHDNPLHWTKLNQNWNYMCAECHSTNLEKNYDFQTDSYQSSWSEINVACEACHGPGKKHSEWGTLDKQKRDGMSNGLSVDIKNTAAWKMNASTGISTRTEERSSHAEVETCALCHSRRAPHKLKYVHGKDLIESHLPAMLDEGLYYTDGQIDDEVYVYGSFLQSKMYQQGVTCSDCHNPHSLELKAEGNQLCSSCHLATKYDTTKHHFHKTDNEGSECMSCHMPEKYYMIIDARADHSFRIPRPDLSEKLDTPNACIQCHIDKDNKWAASSISEWYPKSITREKLHYGEILFLGRKGAIGAEKHLIKFINDKSNPAIQRATATVAIQSYISPRILNHFKQILYDKNYLVRFNAIQIADSFPPEIKIELLARMLDDDIEIIRFETGRVLADVKQDISDKGLLKKLELAINGYIEAQNASLDRPEAHSNLGSLYKRIGNYENAELAYKTAIELDPSFLIAYINLADLYRIQNIDEESKSYLTKAINIQPDSAMAHHSLGLLYVRQGNMDKAITHLENAVKLEPVNSRFQYIFAIALDAIGETHLAINNLIDAHNQREIDTEVLYALIAYMQKIGDLENAKYYAKILVEVSPWDQEAKLLLNNL